MSAFLAMLHCACMQQAVYRTAPEKQVHADFAESTLQDMPPKLRAVFEENRVRTCDFGACMHGLLASPHACLHGIHAQPVHKAPPAGRVLCWHVWPGKV